MSVRITFLDETLRPDDLESITHDVFLEQIRETVVPCDARSFDLSCSFRFKIPDDITLRSIRRVSFTPFDYLPLVEVKHLDEELEFQRRYIFAMGFKARIETLNPLDSTTTTTEVSCTPFGFRLNPVLLNHRLLTSYMTDAGLLPVIEANRHLSKILYAKNWSEIEESLVNFIHIYLRPKCFEIEDRFGVRFGTIAEESTKKTGERKKTVRFVRTPEVREFEPLSAEEKKELFYTSKDFTEFRRHRNIVDDALDDPTDEDHEEAVFLSRRFIPARNLLPLRGNPFPTCDISKKCKVVICGEPKVVSDSSLMPLHRSVPLRTRSLDYITQPVLTMKNWDRLKIELIELIISTYPSLR
jgi:hypothetical protein